MNKVFYVNRSFDIDGRSCIARNSKAAANDSEVVNILNEEAVNTLNDMYEMLESTLFNEDLSDEYYNKIESLLKRARGE